MIRGLRSRLRKIPEQHCLRLQRARWQIRLNQSGGARRRSSGTNSQLEGRLSIVAWLPEPYGPRRSDRDALGFDRATSDGPKSIAMLQAYQNLLESPGRSTYLAARTRLLQDLHDVPSPFDLGEMSARIAARDFDAVPPLADAMASVWLLSPRFHFLLGLAAEQLGDSEQVEYSQLEFSSCLHGILDTGTGTKTSPFVITYATDILDVLEVREDGIADEPLQARRVGSLDVVRAPQGSPYHFELPRRDSGVRFLMTQLGRQRLRTSPQRV